MRGWDAGVQGSRKRGEHTLDCVKHRGSRWRGEFVFKKLPLPPSLPLSLSLFLPFFLPAPPPPSPSFFFFLLLLASPPPRPLSWHTESSRHTLTPFTPRGSIRQQPRTTSAIILTARCSTLARDFPFFPPPSIFSFLFSSFFFSFLFHSSPLSSPFLSPPPPPPPPPPFFSFLFAIFHGQRGNTRAACRGSRTNAWFTGAHA